MTTQEAKISNRLKNVYYSPTFSLTLSKYNALLKFQGGGCAICKCRPKTIRLAVDHCHDTGLLRGILCFRCNKAYGLFHDGSILRLKRAANYLENPPFVRLYGEHFTAPGRIGTKKRTKVLNKMKGQSGNQKQ